jgi:hypothetical protein
MSSILKVDQLQDSGGNAIITSNGSGTFTSSLPNTGITMTDQWRLTATTNSGTNADVTTNWERNDSTGYGSIGTGLTESSGIFSFPQTGIYWINYVGLTVTTTSDASINYSLHITLDNSSYVQVSMMRNGNEGARNGAGSNSFLFDVTDITNDKFKFVTANFSSGTALRGSTGQQDTGFTVLRIGDT